MDERERVLLTLAGVRVFIGVFWLVNLLWRLPTDFGKGNYWGLPHILDIARTHGISPPVRSLVVHVLAPHMTTVGWLVFVAGLLTGLSLVFGIMTRLGAALSLLQAIALTLLLAQRSRSVALRLPHARPALGPAAAPARVAPAEPRRRARPRSLKWRSGGLSGPAQVR